MDYGDDLKHINLLVNNLSNEIEIFMVYIGINIIIIYRVSQKN